MLFFNYTDTIYIGDVDLSNSPEEFGKILLKFKIRTVYLVNQNSEFHMNFENKFSQIQTIKFTGGFMSDSIVLFPLKTEEDKRYFEFITTLNFEILNSKF